MNTHLWLVRHGETDWNAQKRFQGQRDIPLNKTGYQQAAALANRLAYQDLHAIYASNLGRAWDTASIIAARHACSPIADSRLREIHLGKWEGLTYDEIQQSFPRSLVDWNRRTLDSAAPGGESLQQLAARLQSALQDISSAHPDQKVLLVAHRGSLRVLVCLALGLSPTMYWKLNMNLAAISQLSIYPEGAILNLLNDTNHLQDLS